MKTYRISAVKTVGLDITVEGNSYSEAMENYEMGRWLESDEWEENQEVLDISEEEED